MTTGIGAVINTAKVQPGDRVVVFGLGGIGLNVIQGARLAGAGQIVGVDMNSARDPDRGEIRHDGFRQSRGKSKAISFHTWSTSPAAARISPSNASAT